MAAGEERKWGGFVGKDSRTANFLLGWMVGPLEPSASRTVLATNCLMCISGGRGWMSQKRLVFAEDFRMPSTQDGITESYDVSGDSDLRL